MFHHGSLSPFILQSSKSVSAHHYTIQTCVANPELPIRHDQLPEASLWNDNPSEKTLFSMHNTHWTDKYALRALGPPGKRIVRLCSPFLTYYDMILFYSFVFLSYHLFYAYYSLVFVSFCGLSLSINTSHVFYYSSVRISTKITPLVLSSLVRPSPS